MADGARARLRVDERREQLLELGVRLFSERAYDEIAIEDIAAAAGVSKGLLYHYFGGKRAFYVACVQRAALGLVNELARVSAAPGEAKARAGLVAYLDFAQGHGVAYRTLMRSGLGNDAEVAAVLDGARRAIAGQLLRELGVDGQRRPVYRAAAIGWLGQVEATCMDWLDHGTPSKEALVTLLLGALRGSVESAALADREEEAPSLG